MAGELSFPSAEECERSVTPTRLVTVPVAFENVMQYRQVFKAALRGRYRAPLQFQITKSGKLSSLNYVIKYIVEDGSHYSREPVTFGWQNCVLNIYKCLVHQLV